MIKIYKTNPDDVLEKIDTIVPDCWINMVAPTEEEVETVVQSTNVDPDLILKMLDENELPRIESSGNATLVVLDVPLATDDIDEYVTMPLGIIVTDNNYVITVATQKLNVLKAFQKDNIRGFRTAKKSRFLIQILGNTAAEYLKVLNKIYNRIELKEDRLEKSTSNEDLLDLLGAEKSLVYFSTSLKENDMVIERLSKGIVLPLYEDDIDMLEDAMIENRQAIDMAKIYRDILTSITETYASIISNNLNDVMKFLAGITVILSIPTIITSFMGMNVQFGFLGENPWSAVGILLGSFVISIGFAIWLKKRGML